MPLVGPALGAQIAQAITSPAASPEARAVVLANWVTIANVICTYIQANADIVVPPEILAAPGQANLVTPTGPATGVITIPPKTLKVL